MGRQSGERHTFASLGPGSSRLSKILAADASGVTDLTGVVRGKQPAEPAEQWE